MAEDHHLFPTRAGTPRGGSCSPLLALIARHGMDEAITRVHPRARLIASVDDCVVLHEDRRVLEHCQQLLVTWLAEIGLALNEAKSRISPTLEGGQPGFDFLGFVRHKVAYTAVMTQSRVPPRVARPRAIERRSSPTLAPGAPRRARSSLAAGVPGRGVAVAPTLWGSQRVSSPRGEHCSVHYANLNDLVFCHRYPTQTCGWSNPAV